jgi:hypothetical protein
MFAAIVTCRDAHAQEGDLTIRQFRLWPVRLID